MASARIDSRYLFTDQFIAGAAAMARMAFAIESKPLSDITEEDRTTHLSCVVSAIMQSVAALETEIWDVLHHGPGHQLGSNGIAADARDFLYPTADLIDRQNVLSRYAMTLHLLRKPPLDRSAQPWQDVSALVSLRNELTHYKSHLGTELVRTKFLAALQVKNPTPPPFIPRNGVNFFPLQCLSADRAAWAVEVTIAFIDKFCQHLGVPPRLAGYPTGMFVPRPT